MRPALLFPWFAPVHSLKYIGPAVTEALTRLLRPTRMVEESTARDPVLRDLLFHVPTGAVDRREITPVCALTLGMQATVQVTVTEHAGPPRHRPRAPYRIAVEDATGTLVLTYFHVKGDYLTRQMPVGAVRIISGVVEFYDGIPTISHPEVVTPIEQSATVLKLSPTYPLTAGLSQKMLAKALDQALAKITPLPEWLDEAFLAQQTYAGFTKSVQRLHQPQEMEDLKPDSPTRARLAYDELLANQLALALARSMTQRQESYAIAWNTEVDAQWRAAIPFQLTAGQDTILADIRADIAHGTRMVRLLQGDVGSGKTILAFGAMAQAVASGYQACLMAPTDLLARQHLESLTPLALSINCEIVFLSGKMTKSEQMAVQQKIANGTARMVVGTHALFQDAVAFQSLALVVVDEQHRFGVDQRLKLAGKGRSPHLLQMSATPIPRSLTMTIYGDMEISNLTERPPGRKPIDTRAIPIERAEELTAGLARVMEAGERIYWVCPLIETPEEGETPPELRQDLAAAEARFHALSLHFPGKVGLVHGRMKLRERETVMQAFTSGAIQLLVATTVIEVGVNVPEATVMVVEQAERFGLAQLHQLRGRVGRSARPSRCVLLYGERLSEVAKSRLKIMRETNDGFRIAEEDLRLRGAGDVLGTKQTGLPDFLLADLAHHLSLLRIAHDDARLILSRDPALTSPRGEALRLLLQLFEYDAAIAQLRTG